MNKSKVSIVRYEAPLASVRKAIDLCHGLDHLSPGSKVFIKPNIVFWSKSVPFPKWGVVTTSRVVEDMVVLLREHGIVDITIGEGTVVYNPKDRESAQHAFETLGYNVLKKRYGVKTVDIFARPFEKVDLGDGVEFNFNADIINSDFVVDIPVMKTHAQTVVSLGLKNIKGMIDMRSRRKCHSADPVRNLHFLVSKLANKLPPSVTVLDGIYTNERGPNFDGRMRRSNILVASADMFAADKVGSKVLGYEPSEVPHLVLAGAERGRCLDLSDVEVVGEKIEDVALKLEWTFPYNEAGTLPLPLEKMGLKGVAYPKYDLSMCTYCSAITGVNLTAIARAWKGEPWDNVEILTGKEMKPTPGKKTILLGRCLCEANKNHPDIDKMITIKTCPPSPDAVVKALHQVGIQVDPKMYENLDAAPGAYLKRYDGKAEFDESFFRIDG